MGFSVIFNLCFITALTYLDRKLFFSHIALHFKHESKIIVLTIWRNNAAFVDSKSTEQHEDNDHTKGKKHSSSKAGEMSSASTTSFEGLACP